MGDPFPLDKTYSGVKEDRSVCCAWECGLLIRKDSLVKGTGSLFFQGQAAFKKLFVGCSCSCCRLESTAFSPILCDWPSSL